MPTLSQPSQLEGTRNSSSSTLSSRMSSSACPGWTNCCSRAFCSATRPAKGAAMLHLASTACWAPTSAEALVTLADETSSSSLPREFSSNSRLLEALVCWAALSSALAFCSIACCIEQSKPTSSWPALKAAPSGTGRRLILAPISAAMVVKRRGSSWARISWRSMPALAAEAAATGCVATAVEAGNAGRSAAWADATSRATASAGTTNRPCLTASLRPPAPGAPL